MDWSPIITSFLGALSVLAVAVAAYFHARAKEISSKLDENTVKTEKIIEQTNGITEEMKREILSLKSEISELKKIR